MVCGLWMVVRFIDLVQSYKKQSINKFNSMFLVIKRDSSAKFVTSTPIKYLVKKSKILNFTMDFLLFALKLTYSTNEGM